MVVADALNCQKDTAKAVITGNADYLLSVKANQPTLMKDIEDYVHDSALRSGMESKKASEKNRDRLEVRTAYVTKNEVKASEWHYYISSRKLDATALLYHARKEWAVETMHWMPDVQFDEDFFRVVNISIQKNMNMLRKFTLSIVKQYKECTSSKTPMSRIMFDCLLSPEHIFAE